MKRFFLMYCLILSGLGALAQNDLIGINQWRLHLPYSKAKAVAEGSGRIYCASDFGLFSYNPSDGDVKRISKITGLSDLLVERLEYSKQFKTLIIAYTNSNIDLLYDDNTVVNIADILRSNIVGNKSINNITIRGNIAYLATGFGIVELDLERRELRDTWYIGSNGNSTFVNDVAFDNSNVYAATNSGILTAALNSALFNFQNWSVDASNTLTLATQKFTSLVSINNRIYTTNRDSGIVYVKSNGVWSVFPQVTTFVNCELSSSNNYLIVRNFLSVNSYDQNGNRIHSITNAAPYTNPKPMDAVVDDNNLMWAADGNNGLIKLTLPFYFEKILPNGPLATSVFAMDGSGSNLWVASGGRITTTASYLSNGAYLFEGNEWKSFYGLNDPAYDTISNSGYARDIVCVAADPANEKHAFMGTWGVGLLEYGTNGITKVFNATNSPLRGLNLGSFRPIQIGGLCFDRDENLWVTNVNNPTPLLRLKKDGSWKGFSLPATMVNAWVYNVVADNYNQKWVLTNASGIGVFNENDESTTADDQFKFLNGSAGNGAIPGTNVYSIVEDKDNTIWIGTDKGVAVFYNPSSVFSGNNFDAQKILTENDGYAQYLLESEIVTAIAVDGANRKWFGTFGAGAFLQSADGTKQILNFNTSNSPILSNTINTIAINDQTGEVFFGTDKGIISYRGDATEGGTTNSAYKVFPNPVKHDYQGPIAISGLVANASVKIADLDGAVVFATKALGGQAIWDGNNFNGQRAHSGVYMVYVTDAEGKETAVTKLLFIN